VIVPLQQYGQKPRYSEEQCEPYATKLYTYVKTNSPNSQIMIHQTWAYRPDVLPALDPKNKNDPLRYDGYQGMYDTITARYFAMAKKFGLKILPSGAAMRLCQERHPLVTDPNFDYKKRYYDAPLPAAEMPKGAVVDARRAGVSKAVRRPVHVLYRLRTCQPARGVHAELFCGLRRFSRKTPAALPSSRIS